MSGRGRDTLQSKNILLGRRGVNGRMIIIVEDLLHTRLPSPGSCMRKASQNILL